MVKMKRLLKHLFVPSWYARRAFTPALVAEIENAIRISEKSHRGELRFVVEGVLDPKHVRDHVTPRARAIELFAQLGVWNTQENSGVLIYVQCLDRAIEIVVDRGIAAQVPQEKWDAICRRMEQAFRAGQYREGVNAGIAEITALLVAHFPARGDNENENPNELPDKPVVL